MLNHLKLIALGGVPLILLFLGTVVFPNLIWWLVLLAAVGCLSWLLGVTINMFTGWIDD